MKTMYKIFLGLLALLMAAAWLPVNAMAESATIDFTAGSYEGQAGSDCNVNVSINADNTVGTYYVEIAYDSSKLTYVSGADQIVGKGRVALAGIGNGPQVGRHLVFHCESEGDGAVAVGTAAVLIGSGENGVNCSIDRVGAALVHVKAGDENSENPDEQEPNAEETDGENPDGQGDGAANDENGENFDGQDPNVEETAGENPDNRENINEADGEDTEADPDNLNEDSINGEEGDGDSENIGDGNGRYNGNSFLKEFFSIGGSKEGQNQSGSSNDGLASNASASDGSQIVEFTETGYETIEQNADYYSANPINRFGLKYFGFSGTKLYLILLAFVLMIVLITLVVVMTVKDITNRNNWSSYVDRTYGNADAGDGGLNEEEKAVNLYSDGFEKPVISVRGVTKKFRISTASVSGIKEYMIRKMKKQINYRELVALDNVSFDVYKGDVVGIIGTNGSGKSTLLRIISGALDPTAGEVVVDRRKIQLLTLGTGFDMELTARENVYLNGAIIGYSKEFLDAHYDEIVAFAELEGFMEEKVKNFSSGMVSRLGFAIATVGDAAEILILDEVLSVGDEFFRKKSLARVQEMIHGGSTVLMVSHSMDTIQKNCSKVVWIEKGEMKMVGETKEVCEGYQKQFR